MPTLLEFRQQHHAALTKADDTLRAAENARRNLTPSETLAVDTAMSEARELAPKIATLERREALNSLGPIVLPSAAVAPNSTRFSSGYVKAFHSWAQSGCTNESTPSMAAALYEGSSSAGGLPCLRACTARLRRSHRPTGRFASLQP